MRFIIFWCILLVQRVQSIQVSESTCAKFSNSVFHGHSCFIANKEPKRYVDAKKSCNHFPNGHLAFVLTEKTREIIYQLLSAFPINTWYAIALEQVDTSVEPQGGWAWIHNGNKRMIPDPRLILWIKGEPNNYENVEHFGYYFNGDGHNGYHGLADGGYGTPPPATPFLCQYEQQHKTYKLSSKNQMGHGATLLVEKNSSSVLKCGSECGENVLCRSLSYNKATGHCILHITTSTGITGLEAMEKEGYDMYDSHY